MLHEKVENGNGNGNNNGHHSDDDKVSVKVSVSSILRQKPLILPAITKTLSDRAASSSEDFDETFDKAVKEISSFSTKKLVKTSSAGGG